MAAFLPGDIAIGGQHEYVEIKHANGSHSQMVHVTDLGAPAGGPQTFVTGVAWRTRANRLFAVSTPDLTIANCPHAIDNFPDDSGLLVAYVPSPGVLKFRKVTYDIPADTIAEWTPAVEAGWTNKLVRISIACDSKTVFYTFQGRKIKRFDLTTGTTWTDYETLGLGSPYIYGGLRVLPGGSGTSTTDTRRVVVAMTRTGTGPALAVALANDGTTLWTDEIHPSGSYRIDHWRISDSDANHIGDFLGSAVTQADLIPTNDRTLSLAINYDPCFHRRPIGFTTVIG